MLVLAWCLGAAQAATLDFASSGVDESAVEVDLVDGGTPKVLEKFPSRRIILESAVSVDGRFAAVIWQTLEGEPKVTVYDTAAAKIIGTSDRPAYRPTEVGFSEHGNLIIEGMCGTSCAVFELLDSAGRSLWPSDVPGGPTFEVSPDGHSAYGVRGPPSVEA